MNKFVRQCKEVSEKTGVELSGFRPEKSKTIDAFQDDECLHVSKNGIHAYFSVGDDYYTGKKQNDRTRAVLTGLGLEKLITKRVLVEEDEDEGDE